MDTENLPMVGKLVRWERDGKWFTARVTGRHKALPAWYGEVVDPGNYLDWNTGDDVPNLRDQFLTVVAET
jgi:hypothetical protein